MDRPQKHIARVHREMVEIGLKSEDQMTDECPAERLTTNGGSSDQS